MKHMVEDTRRHRWQKWWKKREKIWKGKSLTAKASKRVKTEQATQAGSQRRGKFSHTRAPSSSRQMHFHFISIYFNFFCHRFLFFRFCFLHLHIHLWTNTKSDTIFAGRLWLLNEIWNSICICICIWLWVWACLEYLAFMQPFSKHIIKIQFNSVFTSTPDDIAF